MKSQTKGHPPDCNCTADSCFSLVGPY